MPIKNVCLYLYADGFGEFDPDTGDQAASKATWGRRESFLNVKELQRIDDALSTAELSVSAYYQPERSISAEVDPSSADRVGIEVHRGDRVNVTNRALGTEVVRLIGAAHKVDDNGNITTSPVFETMWQRQDRLTQAALKRVAGGTLEGKSTPFASPGSPQLRPIGESSTSAAFWWQQSGVAVVKPLSAVWRSEKPVVLARAQLEAPSGSGTSGTTRWKLYVNGVNVLTMTLTAGLFKQDCSVQIFVYPGDRVTAAVDLAGTHEDVIFRLFPVDMS